MSYNCLLVLVLQESDAVLYLVRIQFGLLGEKKDLRVSEHPIRYFKLKGFGSQWDKFGDHAVIISGNHAVLKIIL